MTSPPTSSRSKPPSALDRVRRVEITGLMLIALLILAITVARHWGHIYWGLR